MTTQPTETERYFIDDYDTPGVQRGFRWLLASARDHGYAQATVHTSLKQNLQNLDAALGAKRASSLYRTGKLRMSGIEIESQTARAGGHGRGPVLAVWVNDDDLLDKIDRWRVPAICAIPWNSIDNWKAKWSPIDLVTGELASRGSEEVVSNPVVLQALLTATQRANIANGVTGYNRDHLIRVFQLLWAHGEGADPDEVEAWAARNGWGARHGAEIGALARGVQEGKRFRVGSGGSLNPEVIDFWRERARQDGGDS